MLVALIGRSLSRARGLLLVLAALLCAFQSLLVIVAGQVQRGQLFSQLTAMIPTAIQQMGGGLVFASFAGLTCLGFFHPIVLLVIVETTIFIAAEPAWEIEAGLVDLTLARPVPRALALTRTVLLVAIAAGGCAILMAISTRLALHAFAPVSAAWPPVRTTSLLALNLAALAWWFGGLSLLSAALARRRSAALGLAGLAAVFLYLLDLVAQLWDRARRLEVLSPFYYFKAPQILASGSAWERDVATLLLTSAFLYAAAYVVFARRDL